METLKKDFTNHDIVKCPTSKWVCGGCTMSLGGGTGDMPMLDGTTKAFTTARGMSPRMYSWLLADGVKLAFTKAHIAIIRDILTHPEKLPEPPFAVILADSAQKQLIFRAPVAWSRDSFPILLEDEEITVDPPELARRLELTAPIVAATGKPALLDITLSTYMAVDKYHGGKHLDTLEEWESISKEPLSRLAAWLAASKEDAKNEYPSNQR
jgi:CRISPR type IV-associated protein Csf1